MAKDKEDKVGSVAGAVFVGLIIIGTGVGLLVNNVAVYAILGVGVGFIARAAIIYYGRK
ncbi:hypothetical protein HJC99_00750 [Candidatus Saccharibacteria bacterium]|nr:hypothetical protein [Candidatus Saccharibacteria bacterium]